MKEILKNKLFIIFIVFLLFIILVSTYCFAESNNSITYNSKHLNKDITIVLPDLSNFPYYSLHYNDNYYTLIFSISPFTIYNNSSMFVFNASEDVPLYSISYNIYYFTGDTIDFSVVNISDYTTSQQNIGSAENLNGYIFKKYITSSNANTGLINNSELLSSNIEYSNSDILYNNEVVFLAPPQQVEEVTQVTIPAIQQVEEIPQGMSQVLQVIIPIGLIVLSIGLVVYLMRLVIYRMKS